MAQTKNLEVTKSLFILLPKYLSDYQHDHTAIWATIFNYLNQSHNLSCSPPIYSPQCSRRGIISFAYFSLFPPIKSPKLPPLYISYPGAQQTTVVIIYLLSPFLLDHKLCDNGTKLLSYTGVFQCLAPQMTFSSLPIS